MRDGDQNRDRHERSERSRIANNRLAAGAAVGSALVTGCFALLYWYDAIGYLVPEYGPVADAPPLYLLVALAVIGLTLWGGRGFSRSFGDPSKGPIEGQSRLEDAGFLSPPSKRGV